MTKKSEVVIKRQDEVYRFAELTLRDMMKQCTDEKRHEFVRHLRWLAHLEVRGADQRMKSALEKYGDALLQRDTAKALFDACEAEVNAMVKNAGSNSEG